MRRSVFVEEATKGGPGLNGYMYDGRCFCITCGQYIIHEMSYTIAETIEDIDDPYFHDSGVVPQPIFFEAVDVCDRCGQ